MAWMQVAMAAIPMIAGAVQSGKADKAAKDLEDPTSFKETEAMKRYGDMALDRYQRGMTKAEENLYNQSMARRTSAAERAMRNLGFGGVASGISSIYNLQGLQQLAAQNAQISQAALSTYGQYAGNTQDIFNAETSRANAFRDAKAAAIGETKSAGMDNMFSGLMGGLGAGSDMTLMGDSGYGGMYKLDEGGEDGKKDGFGSFLEAYKAFQSFDGPD